MTEYKPEITMAIAAAADQAAKEHGADFKQMLMSSAVFTAGLIHVNYGTDPEQREAVLQFHETAVRNFVADMLQEETPAG